MRALALLAMLAPGAAAVGKPTTIMTVLVSPSAPPCLPPPPPLPGSGRRAPSNQAAAARADRRPRVGGHPDPEPLQPHAPYRPARLRRHRARAAPRLPVERPPASAPAAAQSELAHSVRPGLTAQWARCMHRYCSPTRRSILSGRFPVHIWGIQAPVCSNYLRAPPRPPAPFPLLE